MKIPAINCKFFVKGCKCNHPDAPEPGQSYCIGEDNCEDYEIQNEEGGLTMNYTKGKWEVNAFTICVNSRPILEVVIGGTDKGLPYIPITELQSNIELASSAVNSCASVNPNNPQAVAESIKDMYEALKWVRKTCEYQKGIGYIITPGAISLIKKALAKAEGK